MAKFDQYAIDLVRYRVLLHLLRSIKAGSAADEPRHIWFPAPQTDNYVLRKGNPPPDEDRPLHLRRMKLHIPTKSVPAFVIDAIAIDGPLDKRIEERCKELDLPEWQDWAVRAKTYSEFGERLADVSYRTALGFEV